MLKNEFDFVDACVVGDIKRIKDMVENQGADVNLIFSSTRETPATTLALFDHAEALKYILEKGADPALSSPKGRSLFSEYGNYTPEVRAVIDQYLSEHPEKRATKKITPESNPQEYARFKSACLFNSLDRVKIALSQGVDPNAIDPKTGEFFVEPAFTGVFDDYPIDIITALIEGGLNPTLKDKKGRSFMDRERFERYPQELKDILGRFFSKEEADAMKKDADAKAHTQTLEAFYDACFRGDVEKMQTLLASANIDVNEVAPKGSFLMLACRCNEPKVAELLLKSGADPFLIVNGESCATKLNAYSAEIKALLIAHIKGMELSDEQKAIVSQSFGAMFKDALVFGREEEIVELATSGLVDLNAPDKYGRAPLSRATTPNVLLVMLENGADPTLIGSNGKSFIDGYLRMSAPMRGAIDQFYASHPEIDDPRIIDPETQPEKYEEYAKTLSYECMHGDLERVKILVNVFKIDPNTKGGNIDGIDAPAVYDAAIAGHAAIVDFLLKSGADPTIPDKYGSNILSQMNSINSQSVKNVLAEYVSEHFANANPQTINTAEQPLLETPDATETHNINLDPSKEIFEDDYYQTADDYLSKAVTDFIKTENLSQPCSLEEAASALKFATSTFFSGNSKLPESYVTKTLDEACKQYVKLALITQEYSKGSGKAALDKHNTKYTDLEMFNSCVRELVASANSLGIDQRTINNYLSALSVSSRGQWQGTPAIQQLAIYLDLARELTVEMQNREPGDED